MRRRELLKVAAYGTGVLAIGPSAVTLAAPEQIHSPILDAHIHLFDPTRPGGVPWPEKTDTALYRPSTPERYAALSASFGVVGAIAIEASNLASDNQWLLNVAANHPMIVGVIGDLVPGTPTYPNDLERLHENPLSLGFRYGNLWNRDLAADIDKPGFVDGLKALAEAGLVLESANPDPRLVGAIVEVTQRVPGLRIVIDHLPHGTIPTEEAARKEYELHLRQLGENPDVFIKLSEIPVVMNGKLVIDPGFYRDRLDAIWDVFGEDRILFGSDWPNSDHVAPLAETISIVREYISQKTSKAAEKYYWKNSISAYKWRPRSPEQSALSHRS